MERCDAPPPLARRLGAFFELCKPRVNSLIVFTAMIGMWLASPGMTRPGRFLFASIGIALVAGGAAAINCLVERTSDALMARTRERMDSYTLELHRHGLESVEREVRWLNELIASEREADAGPGRGARHQTRRAEPGERD